MTAVGILPATAQNRSDRYLIMVGRDGDTCRYQIQNQSDQDVFAIRPGGLVIVQAQNGLWVDVSVQDDARGVPGTQNARFLTLRDRAPRDTLTARNPIGRSTEHAVRVQCCLSRGRNADCPSWTDAQPPTPSTGAAPFPLLVPDAAPSMPARGPAAPAAVDPRARPDRPSGPGGPVMRVDEN